VISDVNAACIATITPWLPGLLGNLKKLADGGYERETRKFERQVVEGLFDDEGQPIPPRIELVLIEVKSETADADRAANQYLIDRLLGRPTERKELTGADGSDLLADTFNSAIERIYSAAAKVKGDAADPDVH